MKIRLTALVLLLAILFININTVADDYISHPSNIPMFDNFKTPFIKPGERGDFSLSIQNRYEESMENVSLIVDFYASATTYTYTDISDVNKPPKIEGNIEHTFSIGVIESNEMKYVNFSIRTNSDTDEGTYFVRFQLNFEYNNTIYVMKSKGHFTDEEWDAAISSATDSDPGRVNLESLEVDGIIPDSSFRVAHEIPIWPLYVCLIPLIVILLVFAFLFYCQEEYNMFPWLDQGFKYWSGKFHQFWRLLKHRFG
jgi:hypothetical protein